MAKKARILIEFGGKTYRVGKSHGCASKRDCDLFRRGVCDSCVDMAHCPCDAIGDAFSAIGCEMPRTCFKEVKRK